jgi:hypothetical protein
MKKLRLWLAVSTREEKNQMVKIAATSIPHLYHLTGGQRGASAELAGRIADATMAMALINPDLPVINRMELSKDCAACNYARACINN